MTGSGDASYLDPYRSALRRHGPGFEATLWGSKDTQVLRFDVMIDMAGFDQCTIVDAGCATGDFAARLIERHVPFERYVGIDALPELIDKARQRGLERCTFRVGDLVHDTAAIAEAQPDWVCFSGTLNTFDEDVARRVVGEAFKSAAHGVVVNFLSDRFHPRWGGKDLTPARRFNTIAWLDWAMSRTSRVAFSQAYLDGHDATIMMAHDGGDQ